MTEHERNVAETSTRTEPYDVHTEPHGPHWVAWITRGGKTKPDRSVILIAATQEQAEGRARAWAAQTDY